MKVQKFSIRAISQSLTRLLMVALSVGAFGLSGGVASASQPNPTELTSDDLDGIDPNMIADSRGAEFVSGKLTSEKITLIQILLDRDGFSPGVINGKGSGHLDRLISLYQANRGISLEDLDAADLRQLLEKNGGPAFFDYTLTAQDVAGPFLATIPERIQDQTGLKKLGYTSVQEAIAEKFHMDEAFLVSLNPDVDFSRSGQRVKVANVGRYLETWVARIHADKALRQVTAYDSKGQILAVYPASIGSRQTPSPKGVFKVRNKAGFPAYTLAPDNGFEPIDDGRQKVIAPGPNNPVGAAWIGLSQKTYGIHGTPEPSLIGSAESNGCIRLTNWDAMELSRLVRTGVEVVID